MYQVTAVDDTGIRRAVYIGLTFDQALQAKNEILWQHPRRLWNPRIKKNLKPYLLCIS